MMLPPPIIFGLPPKFPEWRQHQAAACESMLQDSPRFLIQVCPTGFGKSVTYMTAAMISGGRTAILTSTKGLQSQLMHDFGGIEGVADIRGRGNYPCRLNSQVSCDIGPCVFGVKCSMREEGGCFYYDQLRRVLKAKVVITNYAYWMSQHEYSEGLGRFNLLVLDEAHSAPDHVIDHISVSFSKNNRIEERKLQLREPLPGDAGGWKDWAENCLMEVRYDMEEAKLLRKEKLYLQLKRIVDKLARLADSINESWVWEEDDFNVTLSPIWPSPYCEFALFLGIPKVVLTSATVVPKTGDLLGIPKPLTHFEEFPHSFPVENRPLIHLPTVRMNFRNTAVEERLWLTKIDNVIRDRVETKGIIHTVSYARRDLVLRNSKYAPYMISHQRKDTEETVRGFKRASAPCILVSPSMATGWDFPDDECRWQIIIKLPYPDTRGAIISARARSDKDYTSYITMQQLIQATGRGVRNETDYCETFILDNNIVWFLKTYSHLSVDWFKGAYRISQTIPKVLGGVYE